MNRLNLLLLFLAVSVAAFSWPNSGQIKNIPGGMHGWNSTTATWQPVAINGDGSMVSAAAPLPITEWQEQKVSLTANTNHLLVSEITGARKFVEIKSYLPNQVFWVSFTATATVNASRPCTEYLYVEIPAGENLAIIASTAMDLSVVEGGY